MLKQTKRLSGIMAVLLLSAVALTACGGSQTSGANSSAAPSSASTAAPSPTKNTDPVNLRIGVLDDPAEKKNFQTVADAFKQTHPNVNASIEPLTGDYKAKLLAQVASGDAPDILWVPDVYTREFVKAGVLEPLDNYMKAAQVNTGDIYSGMLGLGQVDGKTYMLPRDYNHVVLFVNTTILKNAGLELPKNGWDWNTFVDYVKKTTKKDASGKTVQWGADISATWWPSFTAFMLGFGGNPVDTANKKVNFTDPKVEAGLKAGWDLIKEGDVLDPNGQYPENMFNAGKVAFYLGVKPAASGVNDSAKAKGFDWDVVTFPKLPEKFVVGGGTSGYGVYAKSKHKDEAAQLVSFFVKPEGQKAFGTTGNSVPVLKSLSGDQTWRNNPVTGKNMDAFVAFPENDVLPLFDTQLPIEAASEANTDIVDAMNRYVLGKNTLDEALKTAQDKVNAAWK